MRLSYVIAHSMIQSMIANLLILLFAFTALAEFVPIFGVPQASYIFAALMIAQVILWLLFMIIKFEAGVARSVISVILTAPMAALGLTVLLPHLFTWEVFLPLLLILLVACVISHMLLYSTGARPGGYSHD